MALMPETDRAQSGMERQELTNGRLLDPGTTDCTWAELCPMA
jgi:hypothetical protein